MRGKPTAPLLASVVVASLAWAGNALAQPFEYVYGPPNTSEQAFRRVTPVVNCPGGGYIAIGTFAQATPNSDVYVVRTNNTGAPIWEFTYDVQGLALIDEGVALAELANGLGFVLLSNVLGPVWSPALTQIDCAGMVNWSLVYPDGGGLNLKGHDLIETATGDPLLGTAPGDLAVAGFSFNGATNDAFLMRTTAAGVPIWNLAYDNTVVGGPLVNEIFFALTEAVPGAITPAGDLVAVGRYVSAANNNLQGLAARVNGNNGAIGGAPQCMAHHGGGAADTYYSVESLRLGQFAGQFAMVGVTNAAAWLDDVWVVRGTPCVIAGQSRVGNGGVVTSEGALDVREVRVGLGVANVALGDLALTGYQGAALNGPWDAHLLFVQAGNLLPIFANLFGDHANRNEIGVSLAQIPAAGPQPPGFIIAGLTETDWEGLGDPRDMYLVNTNNNANTGCDVPWLLGGVKPNWPWVNLAPNVRAPAFNVAVLTPQLPQFDPFQVCP